MSIRIDKTDQRIVQMLADVSESVKRAGPGSSRMLRLNIEPQAVFKVSAGANDQDIRQVVTKFVDIHVNPRTKVHGIIIDECVEAIAKCRDSFW